MTIPPLELDTACQSCNKYCDYATHRIVDIEEDIKGLDICCERSIQVKLFPANLNIADAGTRRLKLLKMTFKS